MYYVLTVLAMLDPLSIAKEDALTMNIVCTPHNYLNPVLIHFRFEIMRLFLICIGK